MHASVSLMLPTGFIKCYFSDDCLTSLKNTFCLVQDEPLKRSPEGKYCIFEMCIFAKGSFFVNF